MARRERSINPAAGPVQAFACKLRALREKAGNPTYRALEKKAGYSAGTLAEAAGGKRLPTLEVARAYAGACNGDVDLFESHWREADAAVKADSKAGRKTPTGRTNRRVWRAAVIVPSAVVSAIALSVVVFVTLAPEGEARGSGPSPVSTRQAAPPPTLRVAIHMPSTNQTVPMQAVASGNMENIPEDRHIWLVVQGQGADYYPQAPISLPPGGTGTWTQNVHFGNPEEAGETFILHVVDADSAADLTFTQFAQANRGPGPYPDPLQRGAGYPNVQVWQSVPVVRG